IGKFMRRGLAYQNRAGGGEPLGAGRVGVGYVVGEEFRLAGRRYTLSVNDILEADWDAVQRSDGIAGPDRVFGGARLGHSAFLRQVNKGVQPVVERPHTVEAGAGQFDRRQLLPSDQPRGLGDGWDRLGHGRSSSAKP